MFSAGALSINEIEAIFDNLPVDITFIDNEDTVRYFNQAPGRIFVRSEAIIGRKVQNCHPQKSVHVVNRILDDFKSGKRDEASFWIDLPGKTAYIRYFPVKSKDGSYLGTIEVTQDIKQIRELDGEKRLLDE
jgi:PAS domain S-box-containing protein